jgi:hypothetical protein
MPHAKDKSFSVFHSAAEEAETKRENDAIKRQEQSWDNEGGHMSWTSGLVISTPGAELPYKVVLRHEDLPDEERSFRTMQECEAYIRRNTPGPPLPRTAHDTSVTPG